MMKQKQIYIKSTTIFIIACLLTSLFFTALYFKDNKYKTSAPVLQDGSSFIGSDILTGDSLTFLTDGWTIYPDRLLLPEDLLTHNDPSFSISIGDITNLSTFHQDGSPYGSSTWAHSLKNEGPATVMSLYLPEVFSASTVYIDGVYCGATGDPKAGISGIEDSVYSFVLDKETEILIHTYNSDHYYGGIYYPPALGTTKAISHMLELRMIFYGFLCFSSLVIALFFAAVRSGEGKNTPRDRLYLYFSILCLSFALRVCYPFFRIFDLPFPRIFYALEDFMTFVGIFCVIHILVLLRNGENAGIVRHMLLPISLGMCAIAVIVPLFILPFLPGFLTLYGLIISWYKLIVSVILIIAGFQGCTKNITGSSWILAGVGACGVGIFANIIFINGYEPIHTGWQDEYGMFFLVLCFSVMMVIRNREIIAENQRLTLHLEQEVAEKTADLTKLMRERQKLISEMLHDLKSPLVSILTYADTIEENQVLLDELTANQLKTIREKCGNLSGRVSMIQEFTVKKDREEERTQILNFSQTVKTFCLANSPDLEVSGINLTVNWEGEDCFIKGRQEDIIRILENLTYNAVEFMPEGGEISISLCRKSSHAVLSLRDTGTGIPAKDLPKIFDRFFTTRADDGGSGLGLYIVKSIITGYGGEIQVESEIGRGTEFSIFLPLIRPHKLPHI